MPQARVIQKFENPYSTGEDFAALYANSEQSNLREGSVVKGRVIAIENENVIVDIGFKSEGRIPVKDFPYGERNQINPGDLIDVYVERLENNNAEVVLSREKAVREESWERLERLHEAGETVNGIIFGRVKGGFTVDLEGTVAFLPGSQVDVRPVKDVSPLMNITQPFQILKMDRRRGNIVVSRRAILEESRSAERAEALAGIDEGMVIEGMVKNLTDYGAFVDLGAVDGLLHVTDISWKRVSHPSEVLSVGQTIKVKVIKFDRQTQRISLGMKQMEESPWRVAEVTYPVNTRHKGQITNITDYGAFVELEPGIEGLVHVSEMSWTKKNLHPGKIFSVGQEVQVMVLSIDPDKHRLSLGIKQCEENPWESFAENHRKGENLEGEVRSVTDFGVFVGLDGDLDGLVHVSDLAWSGADQELKKYKKGDKVQVIILEMDPAKERISLGVKQLTEEPASARAATGGAFQKGAVSTFVVSAVKENGIEVTVSEGVMAFIRRADLSRDRVECRPERFSVGDRVDAKVVGIERDNRTPKLSIKALEMDEEKQAIAEYGSADSGASLGGILGVALDTAKKEASRKKAAAAEEVEKPKTAAKKSKKATNDEETSAEEEADTAAKKKAPAKKKTSSKKKDEDVE